MPPSRVSKRPSNPSATDHRKNLAGRIERLDSLTMAPCPQGVESGSICIVQKGCDRCPSCTGKNVACVGTFSEAEFESLDAQKPDLRKKKMVARAKMPALAWELLAAQQQQEQLDEQLNCNHKRQEQMVSQEPRTLAEFDLFSFDNPSGLALMPEIDLSRQNPLLSLSRVVWLMYADKFVGN